MLMYGVDRVGEFAHLFTGRVALVTSPTGRNSIGESTASVLRKICDLRLLLAPEHGLKGNRAAGETFGGETDPETGLPVLSMYSGSSKRLPGGAFEKIDTVVYDIQDVGCRYYTFISTLKNLAEDCTRHGKRLIVLDRPNPLGSRVEGPVLLPEYHSFVGCHPIPVCYGLTCGEFARLVLQDTHMDCDLQVIPCLGWQRDMTFPQWKKDWVRPSPNLPDYASALLYPGTCLIEGTNLSEGRGTEAPFSILGAPFVDGEAVRRQFSCPGAAAEPIRFTPTASKHQGIPCGGIRLRVTDEAVFHPVEMGLRLLKLLQTLYPRELRLIPGEFGIPFVSSLLGSRVCEAPDWNPEVLIAHARADAARYWHRAEPILLYEKGVQTDVHSGH